MRKINEVGEGLLLLLSSYMKSKFDGESSI